MTPSDPLHLILIEEDEADRRLAEVVLTSSIPGCRVTLVGDGHAIFRAASSGPCDAVISPLGVEQARWDFLLKTLRALLPEAPVIVLAAQDEEEVARAAVEVGAADGFVLKSSQGFLDLAGAVSRAVAGSAASRSIRAETEPAAPEPAPAPDSESESEREPQPRPPEPRWPLPPPPKARTAVEPVETSQRVEGPSSLLAGPPSLGSLDRPQTAERPEEAEPTEDPDRPGPEALDPIEPHAESEGAETPPPAPPALALEPIEPREEHTEAEQADQPLATLLRQARMPLLAIAALVALFLVLTVLPPRDGGGAAEPLASSEEATPIGAETARESTPDEAIATPAEREPLTATRPDVSPTSPITLELRALDEVWVALDMDGEPVLDAILRDGQSYTFEAQESAYLQVGNAAGLTVVWNGAELGSLGREGQVRRLQFSPEAVSPGSPGA